MASVGTVALDVTFDQAQAERALKGAVGPAADASARALGKAYDSQLTEIGKKAESIGKKLSLGVTLPVVGGAVAAEKIFAGYESKLASITALGGVAREQVQAWDGDIRAVGKRYGVVAEDVADAMYFITSSGVSTASAMSVLDVSVKAQATRLGEAKVVADLLTSAMNSYGESNLSAARAGDILTAAVRDGKGESDALAGSLATVLPIASQLGVSFDQAAAGVSALTTGGLSAAEAGTQLKGILDTILRIGPATPQAEAALERFGTTGDKLRQSLKERGLLATLEDLTKRFKGNDAAVSEVFGDVRALSGVYGLLGEKTDNTRKIFNDTAKASGDLNSAYETQANTTENKLAKSYAEANDALLEIGKTLAPAITSIAQFGAAAAGVFSSLPGPIQTTAVGVAGLAAVAGPMVWTVGKLASGWSAATAAAERYVASRVATGVATVGADTATAAANTTAYASALGTAAKAAGPLAIVVAGLAAANMIWNKSMEVAQTHIDAIAGGAGKIDFEVNTGGIDNARQKLKAINEQIGGLQSEIDSSISPLDADYRAQLSHLGAALMTTGEHTAVVIAQSEKMAPAVHKTADEVYRWLGAQAQAGRTFNTTEEALAAYNAEAVTSGQASTVAADGVTQVGNAAEDARQKMLGLQGKVFDYIDGQKALTSAQRNVTDAVRGQETAQRRVTDAQRQYQDAQRAVSDAEYRRGQSLRSLQTAQEAATAAQNDLNVALAGPSEDDQLNLESAQLGVSEAKRRLRTGKFANPDERKRAQLDVRRAELDLKRAQATIDGRVAEKAKDLASAQDAVDQAQRGVKDSTQAVADAQRGVTDAARNVADAQQGVADAATKVSDAQDAAARAAVTLDEKSGNLAATLKLGTNTELDAEVKNLERLKELYPDLAGAIDPYIEKTKVLQGLRGSAPAGTTPAKPAEPAPGFAAKYLGAPAVLSPEAAEKLIFDAAYKKSGASGPLSLAEAETIVAPGRADGGPVDRGKPYEVNERGAPELFSSGGRQYLIPLSGGRVVPMDRGQAAGGGINIAHLEVKGQDSPALTAMEIRHQLRKAHARQGR